MRESGQSRGEKLDLDSIRLVLLLRLSLSVVVDAKRSFEMVGCGIRGD